MNTLLLLLLDSRAPAGTHHHSGGMEAAVGVGLVTGLADLEDFCRAKLLTSARVAAAFAAASARLQSLWAERTSVQPPVTQQWAGLDAEFEARTPAEAMRAASRQLGGGLLRLLRSLLPEADLVTPWAHCGRPAPHLRGLGHGGRPAGGRADPAGHRARRRRGPRHASARRPLCQARA